MQLTHDRKKCHVTEESVTITPGHGKKIFTAIIIKLLHKGFAEALLISNHLDSKWKNLVAYTFSELINEVNRRNRLMQKFVQYVL